MKLRRKHRIPGHAAVPCRVPASQYESTCCTPRPAAWTSQALYTKWWTKKDMFSSQHRQQRHHSNEQKCLALVWGIRKDRPYLEDRRFLVRYDSKTVIWLQFVKVGTTKLTHWTLEHDTLDADDTERLFSPQQRRDRPDRGPGIRRFNSTFITSGTAGWTAPSQTPYSSTVSGNMGRHESDMYLVDLWKNVLRYYSDQLCPIYRMFSKLRRSL
jgi:hypothetical protein